MAEQPKTGKHRARAIGAAAVGMVTASVGLVSPIAQADPGYPSWDDVQQAKNDEAATQAEITKITALVQGLSDTVTSANLAASKSAERYFQAQNALAKAQTTENDLRKQVDEAQAKAKVSRMRAGLLAAHLARTGGGDLSLDLLLKGGQADAADHLLYQLGTMSKLTEQAQSIYAQALADKNSAQSLSEQADAATAEREKLAAAAAGALATAKAAQRTAQDALAEQQKRSGELIEQLAALKNTTAEVEAAYLDGEARRKAAEERARQEAEQKRQAEEAKQKAEEEAKRKAEEEAKNTPPPSSTGSGGGGSGSSDTGSDSGGSAVIPAPNGSIVDNAISYAKAQLGKPYIFGGVGPNGYDCSGLTMKAYSYAGVYIGEHGVNSQYYHARSNGQLVPYSERQAGDLLFWGSGPGDFYHVGIYLGGGMMIAAPDVGDVVKTQPVWGAPWYQVARPSA